MLEGDGRSSRTLCGCSAEEFNERGERSESGCCEWDRLFGGRCDLMNGHGGVESWAQDREAPPKGDLRAATIRLHPPKGDRMGQAVSAC